MCYSNHILIILVHHYVLFQSYLQEFLYPYGTAMFIVICAVLWVYLYIYLPETKGRSVEAITIGFRRRTGEIEKNSNKESTSTDS